MDISEVLQRLGSPGKYQTVIYVIVWLCNSTVALNHLIMVVFGTPSPHSCSLPSTVLQNESVPFKFKDGKRIYSSCQVYKDFNSSYEQKVSCPFGWDFKQVGGGSSIVSEWDLVCDRRYLASLATTIYFIGVMIGGVLFGMISDKFGRRPVMLGTLYGHIIIGFCVAFAPNYATFVSLRFFLGMLMQGLQSSSYMLMIEYCQMKHRTAVGGLWAISWAVGLIWMATISWTVKHWRHIQLVLCLPSLFTVVYFWIIPESMRWLVTHGKQKQALMITAKIANINKIKLPSDIEITVKTSFANKSPSEYNILDLFKTPRIRKRALLMFYVWFVSSMGYYGLSFTAAGMTKNKYTGIFISSAVEIPAYVMIIFALKRFGRRRPLLFFYIIGSASCVVAGTVPRKTNDGTDIKVISMVFAITGKFFMAACMGSIFLYTSELFPTIIRNVAMGACTFWTRVGGTIAPQIILLGQYSFEELPFLLIGGFTLFAAIIVFFLPETKREALADTVEETEGSIPVSKTEPSEALHVTPDIPASDSITLVE